MPTGKIEGLRNFKTTMIKIPFYEEYKHLIDEVVELDYNTALQDGVKPLMKK